MVKIYKKKSVDASCLDMTLSRLEQVFDTFDFVSVSFSGGKDSTVCLNLALQIARDKNRLPLHVFTFDEEAIPPETVEYMARVAENKDEIDFRWFCMPIQHRNACSKHSPYWYPWAPEDKAKWVRELPPLALTEGIHGFKRDGIAQQVLRMFPPSMGTVANIMGIRAQESMSRLRSITSKKGSDAFMAGNLHVTNCYPIYDWTTEDVWIAPNRFGWDYNLAYDVMEKSGLPRHNQRCAPPFGEQPIRSLHLFKTCWPELWDKMVDRVPGAATAARYANTEIYGFGVKDTDLPIGQSWRELTIAGMRQLSPESRREVADAIKTCLTVHGNRTNRPIPDGEPDPDSGFCWKTLYIAAKVGGNKFGRQMQKMCGKALTERRKRGILK